MSMLVPSDKIYVSKSLIPGAGRGVFAANKVKRGEKIEICPAVVFPRKDYLSFKKTSLRDYYFMWGKVAIAICLGYGSLYNHSYKPNATYRKDIKRRTIEFVAIKAIGKGEEITVNYNYGEPESRRTLWIEGVKPAA
jgi:SET domain-containing protein